MARLIEAALPTDDRVRAQSHREQQAASA